jgi:hypothetical protein
MERRLTDNRNLGETSCGYFSSGAVEGFAKREIQSWINVGDVY